MILRGPTVAVLRRAVLAILVIGLVGTEIELLLLKHTDGVWQLIPIVLQGAVILVLIWFGIAKSAASLRALQGLMFACLIAGGIGVYQHFEANVEYASDSNPSLSGSDLYKEAVLGSTPTLAPGTMVQLALLGLAFTFRHPRLRGSDHETEVS
ncbi:MAG: hypothetical protein O2973_00700 [Gemmatimonadetes bacterium]|nr:hypothetical protein [Gemmatimonadota bacterium]